MKDNLSIFFETVFINNLILIKLFGLCPFINAARKIESSINISILTSFVIILSSIIIWIINSYILIPFNLLDIKKLIFFFSVAVLTQFAEIIMHKINSSGYKTFYNFLPIIAANCMIIDTFYLNINNQYSFTRFLMYNFSNVFGYSLITILFSFIYERIVNLNVPLPFKGIPIILITIGLISLSFIGFTNAV